MRKICVLLFIVITRFSFGGEYFLAPYGDDRYGGGRDNPWRSIAKANQMLSAGDTAVFLPGEYIGTISPVHSGKDGMPITYRSDKTHSAKIIADGQDFLVMLHNQNNIKIEGFFIDGLSKSGWLKASECKFLEISNCFMQNMSETFEISKSSQIRILDNVFQANKTRDDMLHIIDSSEVFFEGNSLSRVGHCPLRIQGCYNSVVRANVFHCEWGRNYEFWACGRLLIEGNIVTRARDSAGSADTRAKNLYDDSIFRFNRVFGNLHVPMNTGSYIWGGVTQTGEYRWPFRAMNSRFYNNTIADNLGTGWQLYGINVSANIFQNNIFYNNDPFGSNIQIYIADEISKDNLFVNNLLRAGQEGLPTVAYGLQKWTASQANDNTQEIGGFWSEFIGNTDLPPTFIAPDNYDYRLGAASGAINTGKHLTVAVGRGRSRQLPVADGRWFYDGFGIQGEKGDYIAVGNGESIARIVKVELRYYMPALLHLDREVVWTDGTPVSLPWTGDAPDIGVYEYASNHPKKIVATASPTKAKPGQSIRFSLDTLGKQYDNIIWNFGNGTTDFGENVVFSYSDIGRYAVTVRASADDGHKVIDCLYVNISQPIDKSEPWIDIDFEDESFMKSWGWNFKFYRSHQTGAERVDKPDGDGKCMHIFYDPGKKNLTAAQIAPGLWNIDEYTLIKFSYRIKPNSKVAIELTTFGNPDYPDNITLGGSEGYLVRQEDANLLELIDDDKWHDITIDLKKLQDKYSGIKHLRQFMFYTNWQNDHSQQMWFDDFAILPSNFTEESSR